MSNDSKEECFLEKNPKIYNARVSEVLEKYYAVFMKTTIMLAELMIIVTIK